MSTRGKIRRDGVDVFHTRTKNCHEPRSVLTWLTAPMRNSQRLKWLLICMCSSRLVFIKLTKRTAEFSFESMLQSCVGATYTMPLQEIEEPIEPRTLALSRLAQLADHTFILAKTNCSGVDLLPGAAKRATCVRGEYVDACAPDTLISGELSHGYKVTFAHAYIMYLAQASGYKNACVIEEDALVTAKHNFDEVLRGIELIMSTKRWSFIRVGYRPYFFESEGSLACPRECACKRHMEYAHICELQSRGCDMRSSDFYFVEHQIFLQFRKLMTGTRFKRSRRIVDVMPMNSFEHQWLSVPQVSFQGSLDIPLTYQIGLSLKFLQQCVFPGYKAAELLELEENYFEQNIFHSKWLVD